MGLGIQPQHGGSGDGASTPGGNDTEVQFNNGGALDGNSNITIDDTNNNLVLATGGSATQPRIKFGDTGFYEVGSNDLGIVAGNTLSWRMTNGNLTASGLGEGVHLDRSNATATNAVYVFVIDQDTGIGRAGADQLSLISGAIEGLRLTEVSSHIIQKVELHAGITASTTQTQGNGVLLSTYNQISTVANANDTVTLTTAAIGVKQQISNNGANTLQIFPASGDNLGAGVNTATTLAAGNSITFLTYDSTNWNTI